MKLAWILILCGSAMGQTTPPEAPGILCTDGICKPIFWNAAEQPAQLPYNSVDCDNANGDPKKCTVEPDEQPAPTQPQGSTGDYPICTGGCMTHIGPKPTAPAPILPCAPNCKFEVRPETMRCIFDNNGEKDWWVIVSSAKAGQCHAVPTGYGGYQIIGMLGQDVRSGESAAVKVWGGKRELWLSGERLGTLEEK